MRKLKRFSLSSSCKSLSNEAMIEIVGGVGNDSCEFNSSPKSCSGTCSYAGFSGSCVYGTVGTLKGCYCSIS